jgi:hypothetical protein
MAIPSDALQRFAPQPYPAVRALVRDGDILLCQGRDAFSHLIRWSTKSPWSHIAIAFRLDKTDRVVVLEAVEKLGVRCVALSDFVSRDSAGHSPYPGKILLARHDGLTSDDAPERARALAKIAFDRLGARFAPGEITKIGLRIVFARLFGQRKTPRMLLPDDEFICSEYIAKAFEGAGLPIPFDGLGFIAPSDFAADPRLNAVAQVDVARPPRPGRRSGVPRPHK